VDHEAGWRGLRAHHPALVLGGIEGDHRREAAELLMGVPVSESGARVGAVNLPKGREMGSATREGQRAKARMKATMHVWGGPLVGEVVDSCSRSACSSCAACPLTSAFWATLEQPPGGGNGITPRMG